MLLHFLLLHHHISHNKCCVDVLHFHLSIYSYSHRLEWITHIIHQSAKKNLYFPFISIRIHDDFLCKPYSVDFLLLLHPFCLLLYLLLQLLVEFWICDDITIVNYPWLYYRVYWNTQCHYDGCSCDVRDYTICS